jgi:phage shock protein E
MRNTALVLSLLVLGVACNRDPASPSPTPTPSAAGAVASLPDRDPALAHRLVSEGAVLIDVRSPAEYSAGHIDGAVNLPVDDLEESTGEVARLTGGDKTKPIVVYCHAGGRAARAKQLLLAGGYTQVTNLGGMRDWDRK